MSEPVEIIFRELQYNSDEYRSELQLRNKVLRKPLGMSLFDEDLSRDANDIHIGAFTQEQLIAVLLLSVLSETEVKMRQVAVDNNFQSNKVGSRMVQFSELHLKSLNYKRIVLNARKTAVNFYLKLGYEIVGEEFIEVGIPHFKMFKAL